MVACKSGLPRAARGCPRQRMCNPEGLVVYALSAQPEKLMLYLEAIPEVHTRARLCIDWLKIKNYTGQPHQAA